MQDFNMDPQISLKTLQIFHSFFFLLILLILNQLLEVISYLLLEKSSFQIIFNAATTTVLILAGFFSLSLSLSNSTKFLQIILTICIIMNFETSLIIKNIDQNEVLFFLKGTITSCLFTNFNDFFTKLKLDNYSKFIFFVALSYVTIRPSIIFGAFGLLIIVSFIFVCFYSFSKKKLFEQFSSELSSEKKFKKETFFLNKVLNSMTQGVFIFNEAGKTLLMNNAFQKIFGITSLEFQEIKSKMAKFMMFGDFFGALKKQLNLKLRSPKNLNQFINKLNNFQKSQTHFSEINNLYSHANFPSMVLSNNLKGNEASLSVKNSQDLQSLDIFIENMLKPCEKTKKISNSKCSMDATDKTDSFTRKIRVKIQRKTRNFKDILSKITFFFEILFGKKKPIIKKNSQISFDFEEDEKINLMKKFYIKRKDDPNISYHAFFSKSKEQTYVFLLSEVSEASEIKELIVELKNSQSKIISSLAHELRTPLNGMAFFFNDLKEHISIEVFNNILFPITATHHHLNLIVNDYLDFSKIYLGNFQLSLSFFEPRELINKLLNYAITLNHCEGLKFIVDIDDKIEGIIRSDPMRVSQIVHNLIGIFFINFF